MVPRLDVIRKMICKISIIFGGLHFKLNKHTNVFEAKTLNDAIAIHAATFSQDFGFSLEADVLPKTYE